MRQFKLWAHQRKYSDHDVIINPNTYEGIKIGDVIEIYHPEDEFSRLLLQVNTLPDEQNKDAISIEQSIARTFQLQPYKDVYVNIVDQKTVALDLVELTFKEQYLGRSAMWRLKKSMENTCVYLTKKVEFAGIRAQVNEMWAKGEKMACGVVTKNTRIVFRSPTAVANIFIQMSQEMWEFDHYGDLYYEKAVSGFLTDLFEKWKGGNCSHDITITLFSRTFYQASSIDEFPANMRDCLQTDYKGRFYEDFYRCVIQNERYEEWTSTIVQLKKLFVEYPKRVLHYHEKEHGPSSIPKAFNSNAANGNFLEVLNMSLNVFEKSYLDRNFDRTGKMALVISPGTGVFEVDRELTNITKHRTIGSGVGADLVCMGEQPLHAVPLFKFFSRNSSASLNVGDDYSIPHWINLSFYTSRSQQARSELSFIPRIKIPTVDDSLSAKSVKSEIEHGDNLPFIDYDEYDAQVFKFNSSKSASNSSRQKNSKGPPNSFLPIRPARTRTISDDTTGFHSKIDTTSKKSDERISSPAIKVPSRMKDEETVSTSLGNITLLKSPQNNESYGSSDSEHYLAERHVVGSAGSPGHMSGYCAHNMKPNRALINPFAPSRLKFKLTSNRRRWVHAFPLDIQGQAIQPHHQHTSNSICEDEPPPGLSNSPTREKMLRAAQKTVEARKRRSNAENEYMPEGRPRSNSTNTSSSNDSNSMTSLTKFQGDTVSVTSAATIKANASTTSLQAVTFGLDTGSNGTSSVSMMHGSRSTSQARDSKDTTFAWGTGEQEWSPMLVTGMDWKSMSTPASLPITTDYFPDERSLQNDFVYNDYSLIPDDINADGYNIDSKRKPLTARQVFKELVYSRLTLGFQLVSQPMVKSPSSNPDLSSSPSYKHMSGLMRARPRVAQEEYLMSIGSIFQKVNLTGPTITVTCYRPRHPLPSRYVHYRYRFQCPDSYNYDISWVTFCYEQLENYNWNYLDHYICTHGEGDFGLIESLKYWRSRFFLLPQSNPATKKIIEGSSRQFDNDNYRCDIYEEKSDSEKSQLVDSFLRFTEGLNKIRRPTRHALSKRPPSAKQTHEKERLDTRSSDENKNKPTAKPEGSSVITQLSTEVASITMSYAEPSKASTDQSGTDGDQVPESDEKLNLSSPLTDIVDAMVDPSEGLQFLPTNTDLEFPQYSFVSAEATVWVVSNVDGVTKRAEAVTLLKKLLDAHHICHVSGKVHPKFLYGFYVYIITSVCKQRAESDPLKFTSTPNPFVPMEIVEVEVHEDDAKEDPDIPDFLRPRLLSQETFGSPDDLHMVHNWNTSFSSHVNFNVPKLSKIVNVDVDPSGRSDRPEWATAQYHSHYNPSCAFELEVKWVVATGSILGDLVYSWARRAGSCGFHMLPVPVDPFALPFTKDSDPLRGPIFVPLNLDCLVNGEGELFQEFSEDTREERVQLFQDCILKRFGFVYDCYTPFRHKSMQMEETHIQYVHCTGGMFVMILDNETASQSKIVSSRKDYITRQISQFEQNTVQDNPVGFLWSWNWMLTKRWRSSNTGDEHFQDKMLADFRAFCSNKDRRLETFWESCVQPMDKMFDTNTG